MINKKTQYYTFEPAVDTKETGHVFPQISKMRPGYNYDAHNSVHVISRGNQLPVIEPDLDYFIASSKAKITDLMSVSVVSGGFLVSPKLKELLSDYSLLEHKFFPARIEHRKIFYDYYWMHVSCNLTSFVNFTKSKFFVYVNYAHNVGNIQVVSKEDFELKKKKIKADNPGKSITIWAEHIVLDTTQPFNLDFFEIGNFDATFYISEQLYHAILNSNITGVKTEFTQKISFE